METAEKVETINNQLTANYGIDTITGQPMWRVVFSDDQFEHRYGNYDDFSPAGIYLRTVAEVRYVPKYRQWIRSKHVLERLVLIPEVNKLDLPAEKLSYEPIFVFERSDGEYLPPKFEACQFVINTVLAAQGKGNLARYKDPFAGLSAQECVEMHNKEVDKLQEELFGNETEVGDAIAHGEAVIVPRNYERNS